MGLPHSASPQSRGLKIALTADLGSKIEKRVHALHRAPRQGRHQAFRRQRLRFLQQCFRRDGDQPVQGRGDPLLRAVALVLGDQYATLEWVDWLNHRRLLEPIGNVPPSPKHANMPGSSSKPSQPAPNQTASGKPEAVQSGGICPDQCCSYYV